MDHPLAMGRRLFALFCAACSTSSTTTDAGFDASAACKETIAVACSPNAIQPSLQPGACGPPSSFVINKQTGMNCERMTCGQFTVIVYGQPTDSDHYVLTYSGGQLIQVDVEPYAQIAPYCLAGSSTPISIDFSKCSPATTCNPPCTLQQSACSPALSCGAGTQMMMCDGTTRTFSQCDCLAGGYWYCDGTKIDPCPADAGTDAADAAGE